MSPQMQADKTTHEHISYKSLDLPPWNVKATGVEIGVKFDLAVNTPYT